MRKLILWNMITLNGLFDGSKPWDIDWFVFEDELEKYILETQLLKLKLLMAKPLKSGVVLLHYEPAREQQAQA